MKRSVVALLFVALLAFGCAGVAKAELINYTYSGNLAYHNDVLFFNIAMDEPGSVTMFSSSWVRGGFDPIIAIWDSSGNKIYQQDDGNNIGTTWVNGIEYAHGSWDSYFTTDPLAVGLYRISIAVFANFAVSDSLADGFRYDEEVPFLLSESRSVFEFHILGVANVEVIEPNPDPNPAPTPEPATVFLMGVGLLGMIGMRKRFKK